MSIKKYLTALADELNYIHSKDFSWGEEHGFPHFITVLKHGYQIHFTPNATTHLANLSRLIFENRDKDLPRIEIKNYTKVTQQVVANMFADGKFNEEFRNEEKKTIKSLKSSIEKAIIGKTQLFTHYFPAWSIGIESEAPFKIGPVQLISRENWIDSVDFPQTAKDSYFNEKSANNNWKYLLKEALKNENHKGNITGLASDIHSAVKDCRALIKITIRGFEKDYSRKLGKIIAKSALDSLSLLLGGSSLFLKQALYEERLGPIRAYTLIETNGNLWSPGFRLSDRVACFSKERIEKAVKDIDQFIPSIASILDGLLDPSQHSHPKLTTRWATALDWFGEGCRESSDSIAIAKLGTSLDVLSNGGKATGISEMVSSLLKIEEDSIFNKDEKTQTLNQLITQIYNDGRSKVLHGTYYDRLESLEIERKQTYNIVRNTLISAAICLLEYKGEDTDKAFRSMGNEGKQPKKYRASTH